MNRTIITIIKKEFIHIVRDPQSLMLVLLMPLIMLFLYAYAIDFEMKGIKAVVCDQSRSVQSRAVIDKIGSSSFFNIMYSRQLSDIEVDSIFQSRSARCILVFPADFAWQTENKQAADIQVLIDASDPGAANFIINYLNSIIMRINLEHNNRALFNLTPRYLYNPQLKSANFFVPGLIAIILLLISALLTSLAITREKEQGTLEQILVSPINPLHLIVGKVIPYLIVGFVDTLIILLVGVFWFKVPFMGSITFLLFSAFLYLLTGMSFGILISTIASTQITAMLVALLSTMLPTMLLSGFVFPVESMPVLFQWLSAAVPATHFLQIIRGIMLKGVGLAALYKQLLFLVGFSALLIIISVRKFKTKLE